MGTIAKIKYGDTTHLIASTAYGTCDTAANTAAKVATIQDNAPFTLMTGVTIHIKFTYGNTVANPTLNVNSTGAKAIHRYGTTSVGSVAWASWYDGAMVSLTYDGTAWMLNDFYNTYQGIFVNCGTAANAAAKTASVTNFTLKTGSDIYLTFSNTNTATGTPTFNLNGTGAYEIRYKDGVAFKQGLAAGFIYHLVFDGTYWQLINQLALPYATCTVNSNQAKTVTCNGFILYTGATIDILFTKDNTLGNTTLSINGTTAKPIIWMGFGNTKNNRGTVVDNISYRTLKANHIYRFVYDGTNYRIVDDTFRHMGTSGVTAVAAVTYTQEEYDQYVADNGEAPSWNVGDTKTAAVAAVTGSESLGLGNGIISNQNGGATGRLLLYGPEKPYHVLQSALTGNSETARNMYIPNFAGDGYLVHTSAATALGSATEPVYVAANGRVTTTGKTLAYNVNAETTKATQWGVAYYSTTNKITSTAAGTSGYLLQGNGSAAPSWVQATNANTASTIVKRDASGNFSAGTITATLSGSASSLTTARTIDGVSFNGSANIVHYGTCSTAAGTAAKAVTLTGFTLATGAIAHVKFTVTNTAATPTLNINSTGAKNIYDMNGNQVKINDNTYISTLLANHVYTFLYDGTNYIIINSPRVIEQYEIRTSTTSLNKSAGYGGAGSTFHLICSGSTTEGKPTVTSTGSTSDANVLQMNWDNTGGYDSQIAVGTAGDNMWFRKVGGTWNEVATKADVNGIVAAADAMVFKGTLAGAATTTYTPAASRGDTYKVSTAGLINGERVEVGDILICTTDSTVAATSSNVSTVKANWVIVQNNVDGAVFKSTNTFTDGQILVADGTAGKIKTSGYVPGSFMSWQSTTKKSTELYDFGFYVNNNAAASTGPSGGNYFTILNLPYRKATGNTKADWGWQIGGSSSNDSRLFYRTTGDNVFGDWQEIAHATRSGNNIGSATQPVYMTATGVITAGTALKALAYKDSLTAADVGLGNVANKTITVTSTSVSDGTNTFNKYTHPTTEGNKHIPSAGSSGQFLGWDSAGTAKWVANPNTDTKVNVVARGTTKAYLLADTTAPTSTAAAHTAVAETAVYLDTTAGKLVATSFAGNGSALTNLNGSNIASGTVPIARIPTGTSGTTVALGNHTHNYAGSSSAGGAATNVTTTADTTNALYVVGVVSGATTTLKHDTGIIVKNNDIYPSVHNEGVVGTPDKAFQSIISAHQMYITGHNTNSGYILKDGAAQVFGVRPSTIGTTSVEGVAVLSLGNNIATGTANNSTGKLRLYGSDAQYGDIIYNGSTQSIDFIFA